MAIVVQNLVPSQFCEALEKQSRSALSVAETTPTAWTRLSRLPWKQGRIRQDGGGAVPSRKRIALYFPLLPPPPPLPSLAVMKGGGGQREDLASWLVFLPWRLPQTWAVRLSVGGDVIWAERWGYAREVWIRVAPSSRDPDLEWSLIEAWLFLNIGFATALK